MGRPDGRLVTMENMHLFRVYRNSVSGDPQRLLLEASDARPTIDGRYLVDAAGRETLMPSYGD